MSEGNSSSQISVFQDQINTLERQLAENVELTQGQTEKYHEIIDNFESKVATLQREKDQLLAETAQRAQRLTDELDTQRKQGKRTTERLITAVNEDSLKRTVEMMTLQVAEAGAKVRRLEEENRLVEKRYTDAKIGWANTDLELESAQQKIREAQDKLKTLAQDYTMIEVEFYRVNEKLGQTLNTNNDLEGEIQRMRVEGEAGKKKRKGRG